MEPGVYPYNKPHRIDRNLSAFEMQPQPEFWWAMSAVYNRSIGLKNTLDDLSVECFVPMRYALLETGRRKVRKLVPAIRNLLFIRADKPTIQELKTRFPYLQYLICKAEGRSTPIIVPDEQMRHFISAVSTLDEGMIYLRPDEIDLKEGDRVRVHGGVFDGVEGVFMKVKGVRDRRVVIAIEGVAAVAMATIHPDYLQKI